MSTTPRSTSNRPAIRRRVAMGLVLVLAAASQVLTLAPEVAAPANAADPCAAGANPIVCENSRPGSPPSEWEIEGAGDESIQGFATDISVNVGSSIGFKVDTDASAYTIDIYRTGWYQGLGARFITRVPVTATLPQTQPECYQDRTTALYDCGSWAVSASWAVPADAVSGVYVARLHRADRNDESHITFVVRNDASRSDAVFQTADTTWQAYNLYGGANFYRGGEAGRAYKLSYNRPFATRAGIEARDFYFSSEYAMVRFLERNGYDVTYQSGVDTARQGSLLTNHKVFLSVGHDEYWSGAQRSAVESARDAGVDLAFFSGNEVYWRTRYEGSAAGAATAYRTLVSYKETWDNKKLDDTSPEWTGTWRDPRFAPASQGGGRPENGLTGTAYMSNDSDLPVTVSAREGKLRLWRNTSLTSLATGTQAALAAHTVGYESNEDLDNGSRPPGLIQLSTTTGAVPQYLQDFGSTVEAGTTTHHTTLYRAPSGALVFSTGSIQWAWGLDQTHDGDGAPADPRMQQATVNVLADMGIRPSTLMTGLAAATASTDATGPTATVTSPAAGASVANGTLVTATGTASDTGGVVAGVEVSTDGGTTWHPATGTTAWSYAYVQHGQGSVPLRVRAVDDSANIGTTATVGLTVACPCSVYGAEVPATASVNDTEAVELGLRFRPTADGYASGVRFYKGPANTGTHTGSLWTSTGTRLGTVTFAGESATGWQTAQLATPVAVTAGETYVVSYTAPNGGYSVRSDALWSAGLSAPPLEVAGGYGAEPAGVYGTAGSYPASSYRSALYYVDVVFTTGATTPLTLSGQTPAPGATSVPTGTPVRVVLSKPAATGTASMTLQTAAGAAVAGTSSYAATTRTVSFTPTAPLAVSTQYRVSVAAKDALGSSIQGATSWTFTTAAAAQNPSGPTLSLYDDAAVPSVLDVPDSAAVTLGTRFASSVSGVVRGVRFYKGPANTGTHTGALWDVAGNQLASAVFTDESASGWQTVMFANPVAISADTEYVVSYRTQVGHYSLNVGEFSGTGVQRPPLRTTTESGGFSYADAYPGARTSTSYLVDLVFTRDPVQLAVTGQSPTPGAPDAPLSGAVSVTFNAALVAGASLALAAGSTPVAGSTSRSTDGLTLTFTPSGPLAPATAYTATAQGLASTEGSTLPTTTWSFTTVAASGCPCTLFSGQVPATAAVAESLAVELGTAFRATEPGLVTGVRFFKGAGNGGTHTGSLWSAAGTRLRTVTFTGESATGWQSATFDTPFEVTPGDTYVVSYLAPQGRYAATQNGLATTRTVGPLTAIGGGNGRYRYGGGFPTDSWRDTNYFVDVTFQRAAPSAPVVSSAAPPAGATGVSTGSVVSATLSRVPAAGTPVITLRSPAGAVAGTSGFDEPTRTLTFTPAAALPAGTVLSAAVTLAGTAMVGGAWSFTTASPTASAVQLWADTEIPTVASWNDPAAVQVGTRFTTSVPGSVVAIRFYKGLASTGVHTVTLWSSAGTALGTAPSLAESAAGWQTVALPTAVALTPGQVYVAAYHSTTGRYAVTSGELGSVRTRGPLSTVVPGGAYLYGVGYPNQSSTTGYGVDLVFVPSGS